MTALGRSPFLRVAFLPGEIVRRSFGLILLAVLLGIGQPLFSMLGVIGPPSGPLLFAVTGSVLLAVSVGGFKV